jgi:excisionase family DNA binding protein
MSEERLTVRDVATLLNVSPKVVREYIHAGQLAAIDVSGSSGRKTWRIVRGDLALFEEQRRQKPSRPAYRHRPSVAVTQYV